MSSSSVDKSITIERYSDIYWYVGYVMIEKGEYHYNALLSSNNEKLAPLNVVNKCAIRGCIRFWPLDPKRGPNNTNNNINKQQGIVVGMK